MATSRTIDSVERPWYLVRVRVRAMVRVRARARVRVRVRVRVRAPLLPRLGALHLVLGYL